ncbi:Down syndrome cell adhesion molecule-like protein Dscam2 [Nymphon striatum]|nr:Down syndrome cell adhesion molecule-like protein Dscam2 [Nymphon striatum]
MFTWLREDESKILRPLIEWKKVSLRGGSLMLRDVKEEDSGGYQCYINNTLGHLALKTRLIVTAPLRAYIDNQKQVADVGKIVNLTCTVSGYPVDNIKWRLNSEDIVVDRRIYNHGKVLTIKRIERKDAGMYQCFVKNDLQTVQATAQLLLGDVSPEIIDVFKSLTLQPGPTVSLKCIAAGTPLPVIAWLLDDQTVRSNQKRKMSSYVGVGGQIISFLNISGVNVQDGGEYSCIAKNSIGEDLYSGRINVFGIPHVRQMSNITVASGRNVTVKCSTYGYPINQISWIKDGSVLATTDRRRVYANGTIFIIDADRARDSGRYSCIAKNRQGQSASGERYLIVIDKPVLSDIKFPEGVAEGMRVNVLCNILKGEQPVTKAWLKDGHPIASNIGIVITHTSSFSILNIENVRRHHAGTYICSARNSAGQTNKTGRLIVQASPEWAIKPEDQLAAEGSLIILECQGNGYPKPTIKWSKSRYGKSVPVYESGRIEKLINGSLMIRYARKSDQGVYTCEVSNSIPPNLYAKVQVTVGYNIQDLCRDCLTSSSEDLGHDLVLLRSTSSSPTSETPNRISVQRWIVSPRVFINTVRKKVAIGNSTVLKCKAEGDPVLRVEWTNDNQEPLRSQDRFKLISNYRETERTLDLELKKALRSDSEPPSSVQNISILNARNYTIQLSWQKPKYDGASEIIKYVVLYESEPDGVKEVEVNLQKNEMKDNRIKIGGMTPEVQYKLWMVATNKIGSSSNSPFHLFRFAHNGTLILSTGTASRHPGVMPNLMLLLVIPSVVIVLILVVVIIVVFLLLRRSRKRQQASKRINRQSLVLEAKSTEEQMYKNVGLMAELKDKQSERYGKIQSEAGSRYQPLSIGDYKRFSAIELYAATSESGN